MSVKRYNFHCHSPEEYGGCGMKEGKDGDYVEYSDYLALVQAFNEDASKTIEQLKKMNDDLRQFIGGAK